MKVSNMTSPNGNPVPNQFIIEDCIIELFGNNDKQFGSMFQSYDSNIAFKNIDGPVYLDKTYWDYSRTTGKYRNMFLGEVGKPETKKETQKKIDSGEYKLVDLN